MAKVTGSVGALTIGSGGLSLFVGGLAVGKRQWRRDVVVSPYVAGEVETSAVLDQTRDTVLRFRCKATTEAALQAIIAGLVAEVEAATWNLVITVGTNDWPTMTCTRADTEVIFDTAHVRGLAATVFVYTTRNPNGSGPL